MEQNIECSTSKSKAQHHLTVFERFYDIQFLHQKIDNEPDQHRVLDNFASFASQGFPELVSLLLVELFVS